MPLTTSPSRQGHEYAGLFVAFEGGDGAGKSTQIRLLSEALEPRGGDVVLTREPGGTDVGSAIRAVVLHGEHVDARAEALLFAADRAHHVASVVRPALERGAVVLCDRYLDSSIAYQGVAREMDPEEVRDLSMWATRNLLPDLTVLLDVTSQQGRERRGSVHDRVESETDAFHDRVRQGFLALAARSPERYLVLDAARTEAHLHTAIAARVEALLSPNGQQHAATTPTGPPPSTGSPA
ncbi:MAG: dTMP kinase [Ornithinimicrobium sp.]